jgi:hypothetical protein
MERMKVFHDQEEAILLVLVRVEFNFNGLPDHMVQVSGFGGEDAEVLEFELKAQLDTVLGHG